MKTDIAQDETVRITEIFHSLQGEALSSGTPTVFIRLTGCPQRCHYCDTEYAFSGGELMSIEKILKEVVQHHTKYVTVTGGEPLAQQTCHSLLRRLCDQGYIVSLETSGAQDIAKVDNRVIIVMDLKTPASGEEHNNCYQNIDLLKESDQIKFVICNRNDYEWAKEKIEQYNLLQNYCVWFSPSWHDQQPTELAEWILKDCLPVRMQIQLHKVLWGDQPAH